MNIEQILTNLNFTTIFWQIVSTLIFIVGDIIVGVICAIIKKDLDSQKMREGLLRKILLCIVVALSFVIQNTFFNMSIISKFVCGYIILMEIISMFENMKKAGLDFGKLGDLLKVKQEENTINLVIKKGDDKNEERN